jgi:hypothetical protein
LTHERPSLDVIRPAGCAQRRAAARALAREELKLMGRVFNAARAGAVDGPAASATRPLVAVLRSGALPGLPRRGIIPAGAGRCAPARLVGYQQRQGGLQDRQVSGPLEHPCGCGPAARGDYTATTTVFA